MIVSWNTRELLRDCLASVFAGLGDLAAEVIVIDNASSDSSADMTRTDFPQVRLIVNDVNRGFAAANNQGLDVAEGRYVLLLNPDTVVLGDVLERTVAYADFHDDAGVVGCQVMESASSIQPTCFRFPSLLHTFLYATGVSRMLPHDPVAARATYGHWDRRREREVDVVSGMFMLVRREVLDTVGALDEDYFVYGEETDWCYRIRRAGWRCVFAPVGRILHIEGGGQSTGQMSVRMYVQLQKSLLIFHRKHLGAVSWYGARLLYIVAMSIRLIAWSTLSCFGARAARRHRVRQSAAALRYHITGKEPTS